MHNGLRASLHVKKKNATVMVVRSGAGDSDSEVLSVLSTNELLVKKTKIINNNKFK
jgi:hypothetical protein